MTIRNLVVISLGFLSFALLLHFAKPLSSFIVRVVWPENTAPAPIIGHIKETKGTVERQTAASPLMRPLPAAETELRHYDRISTRENSEVVVHLENGYQILIEPQSEVFFELWKTQDPQQLSIYMSVLSGNYSLIKSGRPGSVFVLQNKKIFAPELRPTHSRQMLTIDTSRVEPIPAPEKKVEAKAPAPAPVKEKAETSNIDPSGSLATNYIESVLASRDELFRRCRLTSLRDEKVNTGNLLYNFVIDPTGQVSTVRLLQSDISNQALETCVASVIERTRFRSFAGEPINLSYPIRFE